MASGRSAVLELPHAIEIARHGPATGPVTAVLLHHGLGSVSAWRDLPAAIAAGAGVPVVAYSRRGYGRSAPAGPSPWPVDFMHREARGDLPALLRHLGIEAPVLVGHSDGASISLLYAASGAAPRPRALVLLAPHVFVEPVTLQGAREADVAFRDGSLREALSRHHDDPEAAFRGWCDSWLQPAFAEWNIEDALPRVECPVTVVQGTADAYGTLEQLARLRAGLPVAPREVVLEDCGHAPERERREATLDAIVGQIRLAAGDGV